MLLLVKGFLRQFNYSIHHLGMLGQLLHKTNKVIFGIQWNCLVLNNKLKLDSKLVISNQMFVITIVWPHKAGRIDRNLTR